MSNTYVVVRKMFYLNEKDVVRVLAREKTPDGNSIIMTINRNLLNNIQFPIPHAVLNDQRYFVAIHDSLFPETPVEEQSNG